MSLDRAIVQLQAEISAFRQGTPQQPGENSTDWFLLRAKALGLSMLKRMQQLELKERPAEAERYYRNCSKTAKLETEKELTVEPS